MSAHVPSIVLYGPRGDAWIAHAGEDSTLWKLSAGGDVLLGDGGIDGEAIATGADPRGVAVDAIGNLWVTCSGADELRKYDALGVLVLVLDELTSAASGPFDVAIDRDGFVWVTLNEADLVQRRAADGSLVQEFDLGTGASPENITIRGRREAWVTAPGDGNVYRLRPGGDPEAFAAGDTPSGVAIDGDGLIWVADSDAGEINSFDADGDSMDTVTVGAGPGWLGDPVGYIQANVLFPEQDFDGDGASNEEEIDRDSNPFDGSELPVAFVGPVDDLLCKGRRAQVNLTWVIPAGVEYDTLEIRRTTPGGDVTTLVLEDGAVEFEEDIRDLGLGRAGFGRYTYEVIGTIGDDEGIAACVVRVGLGRLRRALRVLLGQIATNLADVSRVPCAEEGQPSLYVTDRGSGKIYSFDNQFNIITVIDSPFGDDPAAGVAYWPAGNDGEGSLFVSKGVSGEATIQEIDLRGGTIGDEISLTNDGEPIDGFISSLALREIDDDEFPLTLRGERDSPLILANDVDTCEVWSFSRGDPDIISELSFPHPQADGAAPGFGLNGVAIRKALPETEGGDTVFLIQNRTEEPEEFEIVAYELVAGDAGGEITPTGLTIPLDAPEDESVFQGLDIDMTEVTVVGGSTSTVYDVFAGVPFLRGDVVSPIGTLTLADAIRILSVIFFEQYVLGDCPAALDVNDNGDVGLPDGLGLLFYLFTDGAPPAPPFDEPGFAPEGSLHCGAGPITIDLEADD